MPEFKTCLFLFKFCLDDDITNANFVTTKA